MKVADALQSVDRIFLDTAPLIYYVERNPTFAPIVDPIFDRIDAGNLAVVTSPVTLLECLVVPCRDGQVDVQQLFMDLIVRGRGVTFVSLGETIALQAAHLRARHNISLADACQVATAIAAGCDVLLTNDANLKRVKELAILVVGELHA